MISFTQVEGLGQAGTERYYRVHEPVLVFALSGFTDRLFVAYSQEAVESMALRLKQGEPVGYVYAALCREALSGTGAFAALPKGSPPWYRTKRNRWRPTSTADARMGG